ncbi:hypothetical protein HYS94_01770 [Candidatus Daviesbacteria bacterium]|nr:hypothetical protein [Candidatus Daviesbacteria bacterium]
MSKKYTIEYSVDIETLTERVVIFCRDGADIYVASPMSFTKIDEAERIIPTLEARLGELEGLKRKLTSNSEALEAELKATKYHLEDIRKLLDLKNG